MSRTVTIAVAQTIPVSQELEPPSDQMDTRGAFWAIDQNLLDTMRQVEEAATRKADVVHFPEFWLQDLVGQGRQVWLWVRNALTHAAPCLPSRPHCLVPAGGCQKVQDRHCGVDSVWSTFVT